MDMKTGDIAVPIEPLMLADSIREAIVRMVAGDIDILPVVEAGEALRGP